MILSNDKASPTLRLDEKSNAEEPFLDQLESLGWTIIRLEQVQTPAQNLRRSLDQVVLLPRLVAALRRINPFLTGDQVAEVVRRITVVPGASLIESNQYVWHVCAGQPAGADPVLHHLRHRRQGHDGQDRGALPAVSGRQGDHRHRPP